MINKTYTKQELRLMYGISEDTLRRWLNDIKDEMPRYNPNCKILSPLQLKILIENYGEPSNIGETPVKLP